MTEQPKLQPYQRLVADRIKELRGKSSAEKLMSKRAYGLFGSVVHYADFLQGISCIIMDGTQAVADIEVSAGHVGAEESSVTSVCDTVALDTFIQVAGLLINSSDCCIPEHVFVATGIDSAILSKLCDFDACKSWTVYAMFSPSSETTAAGDVFVLTKDGSIAMAVLGVRFTRLPIAKLERMLESANNNVSAPISTAPKPSPLLPAPKALPELTSDEDTEFAQSSASSDGEAPETPSEGGNDENGLKEIISLYTGAPAADIASDANMGDLGVDSLAAVELADDLKSRFGKDISSTDLMMYNLQALSSLLLGPKPQKAPLPNGQPLKPTMKPTAPSKQVDNGRRHRVLQILADGCGAQIAAIRDQESLRDLGFDSLSAVELKSELEDAFSIEVDDQEVHLDSTVGEILKFLGIMDTSSETSVSSTSPSAQDHGPTQNGRKTAEPAVLRDPAATLVECEALFSSMAERCGFTNYWTAVAPKQNELLLAYILEAFRAIGADVWRLATGTDDPVALLFGSSNSQRVLEDFYTNSPMLATLTELLVDIITRVVAGSGSNTVKIVEVGAGFGGTTKRLAAALESISRPVQYTFTDIASTLVRNAVKKLAKYEWMEFHSLNLEHEAPERMKGSFDIAIGTNCVHATKNRAATMSRIRELLNEDGFAVLSEVTQIIDWYDIVYGLLEGWWMSNDADYPLQPPESWMRSFTEAGFTSVTYSQGPTAEANSQRLLLASKKLLKIPLRAKPEIETVVYKEVDGVSIHADIYLPQDSSRRAMPVALLLHGGGHMTLSRKAIRPAQVSFLLANHVIPVSFDYRLCPEINLIDGPITDVRDAYAWCRTELPRIIGRRGVLVDPDRVVVVGWSSGGHLAMSTAWTAAETGLPPPKAVLSFYGPTDFESGDLDARRAEEYPERRIALDDIIKALPTRPITSYDAIGTTDTTGLGWVRPGDPRSELVLSLFKEGNGLPILLTGLSADSLTMPPSPSLVASISPLAHVRGGTYRVPTYLIHGTRDEIVPFPTATEFTEALRARSVDCGLLRVEGARHIHDLKLRPGMEAWRREVEPGYEFLFRALGQ
ncbi:BcPKS16, polyketide synthase [Neofusicoccum parvum]|uniref:BcPKS16, polyketide synthase n=1 Tax=Neofusicoccum parvum TaxID=310453 RepID=A0ACB5RZS7_9PEZI|nr:BcPKS16, polyketide synthase [Neofusicoccum parvum]